MDKRELKIIAELMDQLSEKMEPSEHDFDERLGIKKPDLEVMSLEVSPESEELPLEDLKSEVSLSMDNDDDLEDLDSEVTDEDLEEESEDDEEDEDDEEMDLRERLKALRGV